VEEERDVVTRPAEEEAILKHEKELGQTLLISPATGKRTFTGWKEASQMLHFNRGTEEDFDRGRV
jgi:hypothetical protein